MTNTPTPGQFVTLRGMYARSNGATECPAIITRVWGENGDGSTTVNATAFPDCGQPVPATSVRLFADAAAADAWIEQQRQHNQFADDASVAHWPTRV